MSYKLDQPKKQYPVIDGVARSTLIVLADFKRKLANQSLVGANSFIRKYLKSGYDVLHIIASDEANEVNEYQLSPNSFAVTRPNLGYDFGSWAQSLKYKEFVLSHQNIVFLNSSLVGPLYNCSAFFTQLLAIDVDIKAAVESYQISPHFQSYLWAIETQKLYSSGLSDFLMSFINLPPDREDTIVKGELRLPSVLEELNLKYRAVFPAGSLCPYEKNPSLDAPLRLLASGFPYIKQSVLDTWRLTVDPSIDLSQDFSDSRELLRRFEKHGRDSLA